MQTNVGNCWMKENGLQNLHQKDKKNQSLFLNFRNLTGLMQSKMQNTALIFLLKETFLIKYLQFVVGESMELGQNKQIISELWKRTKQQ